ncbi:hypothetical protein BKA67DRAFT_561245 [Truncatella angustata]|uniref:WSC domain-containing protein n=1 Tax=Truncatella angustata TaxID=152316 RepID=A0A9P8UPC9_9PEZI|nr:uncharacterized protein BKA67DRAFT_561245 [Truncatella angustata]KAH6655609.1 hypothetical protein BKA67DRAFT_561245 [Truncatella angustata]
MGSIKLPLLMLGLCSPSWQHSYFYVGCFSDSIGLADMGPFIYQSTGNCQIRCNRMDQWVAGLTNGTNCLCGNHIPPREFRVGEAECDTPCAGYALSNCGGRGPISIWAQEPAMEEAKPQLAQVPSLSGSATHQMVSQ